MKFVDTKSSRSVPSFADGWALSRVAKSVAQRLVNLHQQAAFFSPTISGAESLVNF
jgi:hypothetical protein